MFVNIPDTKKCNNRKANEVFLVYGLNRRLQYLCVRHTPCQAIRIRSEPRLPHLAPPDFQSMEALEAENERLRKRVAELEKNTSIGKHDVAADSADARTGGREDDNGNREEVSRNSLGKAGMTTAEIKRYSRHLLVPAVGVDGQR